MTKAEFNVQWWHGYACRDDDSYVYICGMYEAIMGVRAQLTLPTDPHKLAIYIMGRDDYS